MKKLLGFSIFILLIFAFSGCAGGKELNSAEGIIDNILNDQSTTLTYYAEGEFVMSFADAEKLELHYKEWYESDELMRYEVIDNNTDEKTITVIDGQTVLTYDERTNVAMTYNDKDMLELDNKPIKHQTRELLQSIRDTHEFTLEETELNDENVYYIEAVKEDAEHYEIWIDKENNFALKIITHDEDVTTEINTEIDKDADIPSDLFTIDLPDDVTMIDYEEIEGENLINEITLTEAVEELEANFLYIPEQNGIAIKNTSKRVFDVAEDGEDEDVYTEIEIHYTKDNAPLFTLSIDGYVEAFASGSLFLEDPLTIRNTEGKYEDSEHLRMVHWNEDGLNYSITILDDDFSIDDAGKLAETMRLVE